MITNQIMLGDIPVDVIHKDIKNVHLSVHPPTGRVRIAVPSRMDINTVRVFALSKLSWIKKQQGKFLSQDREAPRDYLYREGHYVFGNRYLLKIIERPAPPTVEVKHSELVLYVRPQTDKHKCQHILEEWYRKELKNFIPGVITRYEKLMKVRVNEFGVKKMRTKWGTCNQKARRIWINLELAKKPKHCTEYIVVHEMAHLLERNHNNRFITLMDQFLPQWRSLRDELNNAPLSHIDWEY